MRAIPCHSHSPPAFSLAPDPPDVRRTSRRRKFVSASTHALVCRLCTRVQVVKAESARSADETGDYWWNILTVRCFTRSSKPMKIACWGCESARSCRARDEIPHGCHLRAPHARLDPYNLPIERVMTAHGIFRRCPTTTLHFVGIIHRSAHANASFGENRGHAGEFGLMFPWLGGRIRRHGSRAGWLQCICGGGGVGTSGTARRGRTVGYRSARGAGSKHRSTTSKRRR